MLFSKLRLSSAAYGDALGAVSDSVDASATPSFLRQNVYLASEESPCRDKDAVARHLPMHAG